MTCTHCGNAAHIDFSDRTERCNPCHRSPEWCRCAPVTAKREPLWITRSRQRVGGLSRDLTGSAA